MDFDESGELCVLSRIISFCCFFASFLPVLHDENCLHDVGVFITPKDIVLLAQIKAVNAVGICYTPSMLRATI